MLWNLSSSIQSGSTPKYFTVLFDDLFSVPYTVALLYGVKVSETYRACENIHYNAKTTIWMIIHLLLFESSTTPDGVLWKNNDPLCYSITNLPHLVDIWDKSETLTVQYC